MVKFIGIVCCVSCLGFAWIIVGIYRDADFMQYTTTDKIQGTMVCAASIIIVGLIGSELLFNFL